MNQIPNIKNVLSALNIDSKEIDLYLALLETGALSVGKLAKKIGQPRSTIYGSLKKLEEKGFVVQSLNNSGVKMFSAQSPKKVDFIFQQSVDNILQNQKIYREIIPLLEKTDFFKFTNTKFQIYEGKDALKSIMRDVIIYSEKELLAFWPIKSMIEILSSEFFEYTQEKRIKNNVFVRALWPISQKVDIKKYPYMESSDKFKREVRLLPKEIDFSMGFMIYGNKVAFISSLKENFGFIIESQEFANMLKSILEFFWNDKKTKKLI